MAEKYHSDDKQAVTEPLHISGCPEGKTFTPECQLFFEKADNLDALYQDCPKNPGHTNFFSVDNVRVKDLPTEHRSPEMMKEIFRSCILTVRVKSPYTSEDRPDFFSDNKSPYPYHMYRGKSNPVRYGTGTIAEVFYYQPVVGKPCPCRLCVNSAQPKNVFWWVCVRTATHVIYDSSEAQRAEFDCFYHSDNRRGVKTLYGFDTFNIVNKNDDHFRNDACHIWCVTHDHETVAILNRMHPSKKFIHVPESHRSFTPSKIIVSHPHGCSKRITIGKILHLTVPVGFDYPVSKRILFSTQAVCRQPLEAKQKEEEKKDGENTLKNDFYTMEQLINEVRSSSEYQTNSAIVERFNSGQYSYNAKKTFSRDDYMTEFYLLFIRHCSLMNLFAKVVEEKRKDGCGVNSSEEAAKEIFRIFLNKKYQVSSSTNQSTVGPSNQDTCLLHWENLLKESGELFNESASNTNQKSPFLNIFDDFKSEKFSLFLDVTKNDKHQCQCLVIEQMQAMKLKCTETFSKLSKEQVCHEQKEIGDPEKENRHENCYNRNKNQTGIEKNNEDPEEGSGQFDKRCVEDTNSDGTERNESVPPGTTFTLPSNAEYAFRVYSTSPGWLRFPRDTIMTSPDGTERDIGDSALEFHEKSVSSFRGFITYSTNTCPGSSGAAVKFDMMDNFSRTYFPHSGFQDGVNRSGMQRECGNLVYPKLYVPTVTPKQKG